MALALLFSVAVVSAGFATLRALGVAKGALALGLAPCAGLASLSIVATWMALLGAPPPFAGVLIGSVALIGLGLALGEQRALRLAVRTSPLQHGLAAVVLAAALVVPVVTMGVAFAGSQVPLSPHDGAYHVQVIEARRAGQLWVDWYPQGTAALFAAVLELFPWVDSARGALELGLALPLLAVLAVFGLALAVWHDLLGASVAALLLSFTYIYPYFPQLWSGWPLALALILVIGQWAVGLEYVAYASWRWAVLSGLLVGAIVLVHGTELLTMAIILGVLVVSIRERLDWVNLVRHAALAAVVALVCAAPYLPTLFHWAGTGGAYAVGIEDGQVPQSSASVSAAVAGPDPFVVFALGALGIDLPIRLVVLAIGVVWAFRRRTGRAVFAFGAVFAAIAAGFTLFSGVSAEVHQVYAATFPWGMHYRIFMVVAIAQVLLAGAGSVAALRWLDRRVSGPNAWKRRFRRLTRLTIVTWVGLMTFGTTVFLAYPAGLVLGYTHDDGAAMAWLRQYALPGEMLANDGYSDAGIWAPYKAGLTVLWPRVLPSSGDAAMRVLVLDNVAHLDQAPGTTAAVCALHVAYVYRGARASEWDARKFPPLSELRASRALEEVFSSGEATVFRTRLACP